jgi:hypothetical protein
MKFIILISNLKKISPSVFSWKTEYVKNYDAITSRHNTTQRSKIEQHESN